MKMGDCWCGQEVVGGVGRYQHDEHRIKHRHKGLRQSVHDLINRTKVSGL